MIQVFETTAAWRHERDTQVRAGVTLGLVPTMGALHEGHLSLIRRSRAENDRTLATIFVNPTQFDDASDLAQYPRTLDDDLALLRSAGADFVLVPREPDLFADRYRYRVVETELSQQLEGAHRSGHFAGVLTVVLKLLQLAAAERAYFGEKDWQQLTLIRGMADAFFLRTSIVACSTVRDEDGLALSSRNARLSAADRARAPLLYRAISTAPSAAEASSQLEGGGFAVDYVVDAMGRRLAAARLNGVRLIDNVALEPAK